MSDDGRQSERDAIMRAAYRLISRGGTHTGATTSIENILRAAGVNRRIFYRHFSCKDDLIIAMQEWAGDLILADLRTAVAAADTPAAAVVASDRGLPEYRLERGTISRRLNGDFGLVAAPWR